jgi:hypothetical protein
LADLLEAIVVVSAAAHSIKVLRNEWVIGLRQCKPVQRLIAVVTGGRSHSQADKMINRIVSPLQHLGQIAYNNIGSRHQGRRVRA